jgi:ABC-type dipeptide/oligopeptide/nickel transport system ATPase component
VPREEREFTAVEDVSLDVRGSEFVSIVGPSGCGKSTLLGLIAGLVPITEGRILVGGRPVDGIDPRLGYVFRALPSIPALGRHAEACRRPRGGHCALGPGGRHDGVAGQGEGRVLARPRCRRW